jgi:hypothetical protein
MPWLQYLEQLGALARFGLDHRSRILPLLPLLVSPLESRTSIIALTNTLQDASPPVVAESAATNLTVAPAGLLGAHPQATATRPTTLNPNTPTSRINTKRRRLNSLITTTATTRRLHTMMLRPIEVVTTLSCNHRSRRTVVMDRNISLRRDLHQAVACKGVMI